MKPVKDSIVLQDPGTVFSVCNEKHMAKAIKKKASKRKASPGLKKNKLGVKNSLVNNINAKKKKGTSHSKKNSTVSKESYDKMENGWED
jgi:hypothetical protein